MIFTVLIQMAVGAFTLLGAFTGWVARQGGGLDIARRLTLAPLFGICLAFAFGLLASLLHLGRPQRAYRALLHLGSSWLSREILLVGMFGVGWVIFSGLLLINTTVPAVLLWVIYGLSTLSGLALIYCMAQVYRLQGMPAWDNWMTSVSFFLTASLLGVLFNGGFLTLQIAPLASLSNMFSHKLYSLATPCSLLGLLLLVVDLGLQGKQTPIQGRTFWIAHLRLALTVTAMLPLAMALSGVRPNLLPILSGCAFCLALVGQFIGRWQFYARLAEREL